MRGDARAAAEREAHLLELRLKSCDLSRRFSEKSFEDFTFYGTVREKGKGRASRWPPPGNLPTALPDTSMPKRDAVHGRRRHRQGTFCAGILNQIIRNGYSGLFTKMPRLLREIKDTYNRNSEISQSEIINQTVRVDLLIVDEVGVQFGTETERMIIYEIRPAIRGHAAGDPDNQLHRIEGS